MIEEAPAPGLSERTAQELRALAVRAARAVSYVGAGTVEFLVADGRAHFLEMNTRLQVEHPVTEAVFGLDLVAEQIRVAEGAALAPEPPRARGHAVEARLYAEDPANNWTPQTGTLHRLAVPEGVRLDTGFGDGDDIGVHYDPMLAKVVAHAPTRAEAIRRLAGALERTVLHGPVTNRDLLVRSLRHAEFTSARMDTGFYDRHLGDLTVAEPDPYAPLAAALADARTRSPLGGWRNLPSQPQTKRYAAAGEETEVRYRHTRTGLTAEGCRWCTPTPAWSSWRSTAYGAASRSPATATASTSTTPPSPRCPASPPRRPSTPPAPCSRRCPARSSSSRTVSSPDRVSGPVNRCCGSKR